MADPTILIVGANGGVGQAVTEKMIAERYAVAATVSRPEKQADFLSRFPQCSVAEPVDLSCADSAYDSVKQIIASIDTLAGVIVCGAVSPFAPSEMTDFAMFRRTMEINTVSHLAIYRAALPALRRTKGRLIFTGSLSGRVATPMMGAYVSSKFALEGLTDVMRQEASMWDVQVILLQPGSIDTPIVYDGRGRLADLIDTLEGDEKTLYGDLYQQMHDRIDQALEQGGLMPPSQVADAAYEALTASVPQTRYRVGADAEFLLDAKATKSDRELDDIVLGIYRQEEA